MASKRQSVPPLTRRDWLRLSTVGAVAATGSSWLRQVAARAAEQTHPHRSCILLWMAGGPSQLETFDPKPEHENGGPTKAIATSVPDIQIAEPLADLAPHMEKLALVRSMNTTEGDHQRATYLLRTGRVPQGPIRYPSLGAAVAKELGTQKTDLPNFVSIAPETAFAPSAYGAGFLGPKYAPLTVANRSDPTRQFGALGVSNLSRSQGILGDQFEARLALLHKMGHDFAASRPDTPVTSHRDAYDGALRMMRDEARQVLDLTKEPASVRDAYGRNQFGQGCLLARRLVEYGIPFVEVTLSDLPSGQRFSWDTHRDNFNITQQLGSALAKGWSRLLNDLDERGLLESTLIVWMGEFGRTPTINQTAGRDHFPTAWSTALAGGGIDGGKVIGATSADGNTVIDRPVTVPDLLATVCSALGVATDTENMSNIGRPIPIVDSEAQPITEVLA